MSNRPKFTVLNDVGQEVELPARFAVCDRCDGTGVHDNENFNGLGAEDFQDEDFRESYLKGEHDVRCSVCKGARVVAAPDLERLTPEQQLWLEAHWRALHEERAERRLRMSGVEF